MVGAQVKWISEGKWIRHHGYRIECDGAITALLGCDRSGLFAVTVKVASLLFATPKAFETTQRNFDPFSPRLTEEIV